MMRGYNVFEPPEGTRGREVGSVVSCGVKRLRKTYRTIPKIRIVCEVNGTMAGTALYQLQQSRVYIYGLFVLTKYQRRGIAQALLKEVEQIARKNRKNKLWIDTVQETGNVPIFERLGFRVIRTQLDERYESDKHESLTSVLMEKRL